MKKCDECGSNDWWFKSQAGMTVATCKNCKNELRWARKKKKKISNSEPDACECGNRKFTREKQVLNIEVLQQQSYFMYYYICNKCKKRYPDKTTKRNNAMFTKSSN